MHLCTYSGTVGTLCTPPGPGHCSEPRIRNRKATILLACSKRVTPEICDTKVDKNTIPAGLQLQLWSNLLRVTRSGWEPSEQCPIFERDIANVPGCVFFERAYSRERLQEDAGRSPAHTQFLLWYIHAKYSWYRTGRCTQTQRSPPATQDTQHNREPEPIWIFYNRYNSVRRRSHYTISPASRQRHPQVFADGFDFFSLASISWGGKAIAISRCKFSS